jgi:alkylation response protein AidB-like acyl-CoA dehydrogenase
MNFDFTPECKAMAQEVRRVLALKCPMQEVRRCLEAGTHSEGTWQALVELGVIGAAVPETWGGSGLGDLELAACAEEVGRACAPVPMLASVYLAAEALVKGGTDAQRARWLPDLAAGRAIGTVATSAEGCTFLHGRFTGTLRVVPAGLQADFLVVPTAGQQLLVDLHAPQVTRRALRVLDPGNPMALLTFQDAPAQALAPEATAADVAGRLVDRAAALLAFEQLGGAQRALEMACSYAAQRRTFGRQVGSYQAVKHRLADVWVRSEIARGHAYRAAWALQASPQEVPLAAAAARVACSEAFEFAAQENLQLHGGLGFTWEADCHPLYKRARSSSLVLGPTQQWKQRLAALAMRWPEAAEVESGL